MTDRPASRSSPRRLAARLRLARAALLWERVWPAAWPALCVLGILAVLALFDVLPRLPGAAHAGVLALFAIAFVGVVVWGARAAGVARWRDPVMARRRIEEASGLPHRPLEALADRPSAPLDGPAAMLWAAHQRRMAEAVRRLRVGWPASGLARRDPWGVRSVLAILLLLGVIDAGADWRDRVTRAFTPVLDGGPAAIAASFDLWLTPPEYTGLAPQFLRTGDSETVRVASGSSLLAQVHGGSAVPRLGIDGDTKDFAALDKLNFRFEATLTSGNLLTLSQGGTVLGRWPIAIIPDNPPTIGFAQPPKPTPRAALRLEYQASDDYGVESAKAVIRLQGGGPAGAHGDAIELELPLPGLHLKEAAAVSYHDLSPHPWAGQRLRHIDGTEAVTAIEQLLWDTALRIEDGHMSMAESELRRLQQALQDALAKGAPDPEIERLMQELREALDRYLQALAQELQRHPNDATPPLDPSQVLTGRDLQRMLDRAGELARSGARDQARELLSQLQSMLENLRAAQPGQQRGNSQAQQMMRGLQDLMQRQQQLLDRSFRAQRQGQQ